MILSKLLRAQSQSTCLAAHKFIAGNVAAAVWFATSLRPLVSDALVLVSHALDMEGSLP